MKRTAAIALGVLVACCRCAFALNPAFDASQYAHFAWRYRDGFIKGEINALAQTPDGYLWLGTSFGMVRFDGVRAVPWQPPPDQPLPSSSITHLIPARDGTLWIGTRNGLASWKNGRLTQYAELARQPIDALMEDREGSVWVGAYGFPDGKLCEIRRGVVQCHPELGGLGRGVFGLEDGKGNLWVGVSKGLWRWKPGTPEFYAFPDEPSGVQGMANGGDGELLISTKSGVKRLIDGKFQTAYPFPPSMQGLGANHFLHDRDGGLWVSPYGAGIVHIHQGRTDLFSRVDGLTGDLITGLFEDREGIIWVATTTGLDRFRDLPVVTYSASQGLGAPYGGVLATRDGSIWFSTSDGLIRLDRGQLTAYRQHAAHKKGGAREVVVSGLTQSESLFQDSRGRIWIATLAGVGYLEGEHFTSTSAPGRYDFAITEDAAGNVWIANQEAGLIRILNDEVQRTPWIVFGHRDPAAFVLADPRQGGIWLGFGKGGILWYRDGQPRASYSAAQGLAPGRVHELRFDGEGTLWIAADGGLSRLKNGRIATLTSRNGMPCDGVQWMIGDDAGAVWMNTPCGLVRSARAELDAWAAGADTTSRTIRTTVFDAADGAMPTPRPVTTFNPRVAKSRDGKLWFVGDDGFSVVDPLHLAFNHLPPPVHIEQITADGKIHEASSDLRLPPLVRELEIDYTALSLAAPEKNRFRYKLEGYDRDWQDAGNRRQAYYTNLDPRSYRFRVRASNNDGVWNEAGASLEFSIAPAYYQTTWFALLVVAAVLAFLALLYQLRLRYLKHQFDIRLEARVGERTRIARDLHDTLLQSFQGALMKFHAVTYMLPDSPVEAQKTLERVLDQAQDAVNDGRKAVQGLRSSTVIANDLARAITAFAQGVAADHTGPDCPECRVQVEGQSRDLPPLVRDEVYQIACESLRNGFRHAQAKRIDVEIRYDPRQFRLRIVDNGKGIDPAVLSVGGRAGHHGLPGLHERAQLAGGKLSVSSQLNSGTEIGLTVPAGIAYTKPPARRSIFLRKGAG